MIVGCVVLYQPREENIQHILQYAPLLKTLFVLDNSDTPDVSYVDALKKAQNVVYLSMGGNMGIAAALRRGLAEAIACGADFCLTMDQDSTFPIDRMEEIGAYLSRPDVDDYAVIGLNYEGDSDEKGLVEVRTWITSGNFINVKNYLKTEGFREELFIDSVDHELCHQFYKIGKKVAYINEIRIGHSLGELSCANFLGRRVSVTNHSPLRYYYRFRNNYVLYREDREFYSDLHRADVHHKYKIILFEKDKREKLRMIRRAIRDAKDGRLGKFREEV